MNVCRFDDDRIGLVRGTAAHDVTRLIGVSHGEPVLAARKVLNSVSDQELARTQSCVVGAAVQMLVCLYRATGPSRDKRS